jgi:Protein of unknown function (DUF3089)
VPGFFTCIIYHYYLSEIMMKYFLILSSLLFAITSCSKKNYSHKVAYQFKSIDSKPDYSDLHYWAAHPYKWDPSDSVPKPLRKNYVKDSVADVFFVHPTTLTNPKNSNSNALIDDAIINAKTDYSSLLYQASAFNESCRVFAPRYRQAHYGNYFTKDTVRAREAFELAYQDVKNAFETYLKMYNNGRPIIIAAHSQGTTHAARLLKEYFEGKPLQYQLVCAYIVGMPVPEKYFTNIQPCKDSTGTGCYVTWRSFKKGYEGSQAMQKETFKVIVTNPHTWTTDTLYAPASLNTGAVLRKFNKVTPGAVDAQVHKNILWTSKPKFFGNFLLTQSNYHIGDINFFYSNIRENVKTRLGMFLKKQ